MLGERFCHSSVIIQRKSDCMYHILSFDTFIDDLNTSDWCRDIYWRLQRWTWIVATGPGKQWGETE